MKRKGEEMMRKEKMEKKDAAWRKNNQGMGTVEMILIIVEIYIFYLYVFNVYTVI